MLEKQQRDSMIAVLRTCRERMGDYARTADVILKRTESYLLHTVHEGIGQMIEGELLKR